MSYQSLVADVQVYDALEIGQMWPLGLADTWMSLPGMSLICGWDDEVGLTYYYAVKYQGRLMGSTVVADGLKFFPE